MPIYTVKNQEITIQVDSYGAELKSLRDNENGQEYMWYGDETYWRRTSPILFPVVGTYRNNQTTYQGKTYTLPQHGFARNMEFELLSQTENTIVFSLHETEETLKNYPFAFCLELEYRLTGRSVEAICRVKNPSGETMYFSVGGHPGFNCPVKPGEKKTDYRLRFDTDEKLVSRLYANGGITDTLREYQLKDGAMQITEGLFDDDALIMEKGQAHQVSLVKPDGEVYVTVEFDTPVFGIWSYSGEAPFVCVEPWNGRPDAVDFKGDLTQREWGNELAAGEVFEAQYKITVYKV